MIKIIDERERQKNKDRKEQKMMETMVKMYVRAK